MSVEKVQEVFQEVFEDPELEIFPVMAAKDVDGWDSYNHINLIVAFEEKFEISFTTEEIGSMANVGDLVRLLSGKGQALRYRAYRPRSRLSPSPRS